jgi:acyl transferase domain-containing protein
VDGHSILPAAAYLEMARVAIKHALPTPPEMQDSMVLELRDTVWLQPLVVTGHKQISIALFANDDDQVGYEISGIEAEQKIIYCEGHALFSKQFAPASRDIARLKSKMKLARLEPSYIYATFASMGLNYGPAHQGITALYVGEKQLLAQLRLPAVVAPSSHQYVLHPSLIDGALQASIGLMSDFDRLSTKPFVPFVLESLRVLSACTTEMVAWVRCSDSTKPKDVGMKVNIDLCDQQGNVCVQILGFSSRVLQSEVKSTILPVKWNSHGRLTAVEDGPAFDSVFYRDLIAELVNHDISLDEAVELG